MTIISAISEDGVIIKDGADGLKEFNTPTDLKKYIEEAITLNAPTNPNAVLVASTGSTPVTIAASGTSIPTPVTVSPSETTEELPLTGMDSTIFIVIAAALGLILILRRRTV
jgi:LPXTG-motif cell wall-anchored protein